MIVVSNSSPLVALARISRLNLLASLHKRILIPAERVATVSVFLTVGFSLDDELEYMHLNAGGKGWGSGFGARDSLSAVGFRLTTRCY